MTGDNIMYRKVLTRSQKPRGSRHKSKGKGFAAFTLVEMIIALGIFGMVALAVIAIFVLALRMNKQTSARQAITDNTRYVIEFMEREMRTGRAFTRTGNVLEFTNDRNKIVRYQVNQVHTASGSIGVLQRFNQDSGQFEDMTNMTVSIANPNFFELQGTGANDMLQPRVTLLLQVRSVVDPAVQYHIEATISQRDLDS